MTGDPGLGAIPKSSNRLNFFAVSQKGALSFLLLLRFGVFVTCRRFDVAVFLPRKRDGTLGGFRR